MKVKDLLSKNAFVINLDRDTERLHRFYDSFDTHNIQRPTRLKAVDAKSKKNKPVINKILSSDHTYIKFPTEAACALSHWSILTKALKEDWDWIVVFEDDVVLCPFTKSLLERNIPEDWDILYLGHCPNHYERNPASICPPYKHKPIDGWFRFKSAQDCAFGMYGYAIRKTIIHNIISSYSFHCALDYHILMNHSSFKVYGLYPCLVIHDYHYGSYSNPLRKEVYPIGTSLEMTTPLIIASMGASIMGVKSAIFSAISLVLIIFSWIQGRHTLSIMETFKRRHPNFPGIYGIDSYAAFCNAWTIQMIESVRPILESLGDRSFIWGHTLLGLVRDGSHIPWESHICIAHPANTQYSAHPNIRWVPYIKRDGWILIDSLKIPYFSYDRATLFGCKVNVPDIGPHISILKYGPDCMTTIKSPSFIDIDGARWPVPSRYKCSIKLRDLNADIPEYKEND